MKRLALKYLYTIAIFTMWGLFSAGPALAQAGAETSVSRAVERMICQNLANQVIGEGAAYKPGVSASGKDVTPAEGDQQVKQEIHEVVAVPLTVDLARRMGIDTPEGVKLEKQLGTLRIDRKGTIRFQDDDITDKARQLCNRQTGEGNKGPELPVPDSQDINQPPADLQPPKTPEMPSTIQSPNAPGDGSATPEQPASGAPSMRETDAIGRRAPAPDTPDRPSAPSNPVSTGNAVIDEPVRDPEMQGNKDDQRAIRVPLNADTRPRAYKLTPGQQSKNRP